MKISRIPVSLNQPYPYYYGQPALYHLALVLMFLSFGFNYLFEPFEVYQPEHKMHFAWISFLHGLFPAMVFYGYFSLLNFFQNNDESWTVKKELIHLMTLLFMIGLVNFLIRDIIYDNPHNQSFRYLYEEIRNTFLVGTLLILLLTPLNFIRLYLKNNQELQLIKRPIAEGYEVESSEIHIQTQVKADDFLLDLKDFLFAKAEGNYVEFFFHNGAGYQKELKRILIKDVERHLEPYNWIIKTHRSYLVNLKKIKNVVGNAQGYQLQLKEYPESIPVSRGMIKTFNTAINKNL